ncbi:pyridoxal phosphate-dependent decarboxylase family protein [Vagococcus elongatus]|uniref:Glutamate decarboxylase n=1 Tax=Vagococcus elongatus TaxID=180344 RepID=A0A430AUW7_9ENTE|nr:aminotransferase class V-fold PLP-dependent enzyme [Vagococcus elongatus]RSU11858.1 hypothetical protein CBF29_06990 [Vagococcus elongatus]
MGHHPMKEQLSNIISTYFEEKTVDKNQQLTYKEPSSEAFEKIIQLDFPADGRPLKEMVQVLKEEVFPYRVVGEHPRSFAFVPAPVEDVSKLGDILTTLYNPNAAGWFSAPVIAQIHKLLIDYFCQKMGYTKDFGGVFVSGGSLANLTALIAARDDKLELDQITKGVAYVSAQAHHSINKGLRMAGIPDSRIRRVKTDGALKMIPESLEEMIQEDQQKGLIPFVVIGTSGTTNSGTIDPLEDLGKVCQRHNVWFHVDGAFGASVIMSKKNASLLKGIEYADSTILDAHKWLYQTYTCAMVLVKDKKTLLKSFSDDPSYLQDAHSGQQIDSWDIGPELSRPALGVKLWLTLQVLGTDKLAENIDYSIEMAKYLETELKKSSHWEIVSSAQLAMINFRYIDKSKTEEELDQLNSKIAQKIQGSGWANILTTELKNKKVIRICTISPKVTKEDLLETIDRLDTFAAELLVFSN